MLVQKSLIKVDSYGRFEMHDLIEEMAHYIVRGEHSKSPEKHSRIWKEEDIAYLYDMGADAPPMETEVLANFHRTIDHPGLSDVVSSMKKLRWIRLYDYPASSFPSNFKPKELGYLELMGSQQKELWHGLKEIDPSIGYHKRLVYVDMGYCKKLKRFPPIKEMKKLETLDLSYCIQLQQFPDIKSNMDSLVTLDLSLTDIEIIPTSVGRFCTNLVSFILYGCQKLKRIEGSFLLLKSLKDLNLHGCLGLQSFHHGRPMMSRKLPQFPRSLMKLDLSGCNLGDGDIPSNIFELLNLQLLYLSRNKFSRLPSGLSQMSCLKLLKLSKCVNLVELPDLPSSIAILYANCCDSLESVEDLSNYKWLWKVSLWEGVNNRVLLSMLEKYIIVIKQEMSTDQSEKFDKDCREPDKDCREPHNYKRTHNIGLNVELVRSKSKIGVRPPNPRSHSVNATNMCAEST
ncbi:TMV resistance protein N-like [Helianthus annuus]|uniref:TMV resistance protein N-like n=1 Tax=Helianthus annuus TaxID=4232 RepID=UPI001653090A|nr:TMV resistance protein N-like [Helianthus annuus]